MIVEAVLLPFALRKQRNFRGAKGDISYAKLNNTRHCLQASRDTLLEFRKSSE
jgi:hypothetical protein